MENKTMGNYCSKCIMKEENFGVELNQEGICNFCTGGNSTVSVDRYRAAIKNCMEFEKYLIKNRVEKSNYDCLLMLSGGKDSIFMLYKLVTVYGAKPLAFTFNHPFESRNAVHNIERVIEKLGVEHICMTPNINIYKKMMKKIFAMDREELVRIATEYGMRAEKMPCVGCTNLMQIYAFILTKRFEIPYLLYCADPIQMTGVDYDINRVFSVLKRICGEDLLNEFFGSQSALLQTCSNGELPKLVFPYATMKDYSSQRIITELMEKGLYKSSPEETHCSLYALLNYFSFKKFDCYYYAVELASSLRNGEQNRNEVIHYIEFFKDVLMEAADGSATQDEKRNNVGKLLRLIFSDSQADYLLDIICNISKTAQCMGLDLANIK